MRLVALCLLVPLLLGADAPQKKQKLALFAKRDIAAGDVLQQADVELRPVPAALFPGAVDAKNVAVVVGRRLVFPVLAQGPVRWSAFRESADNPTLAACVKALGPQASAREQVAEARQALVQRHGSETRRRLNPGR